MSLSCTNTVDGIQILTTTYFFVNCIKIRAAIQKHTACHSGYTAYYGNFGLWQGSLDTGTHNIASGEP